MSTPLLPAIQYLHERDRQLEVLIDHIEDLIGQFDCDSAQTAVAREVVANLREESLSLDAAANMLEAACP